ncbi:hypothetical protein [Modicisalibacter radicis]|uniref:hypothetical protein n=1 Tax=Halomonas sp. EAR18 TaxID=2518972 RepID=UPI00109CBCFC|nr:hypothetical protein [Halomonas sp. EAR18]
MKSEEALEELLERAASELKRLNKALAEESIQSMRESKKFFNAYSRLEKEMYLLGGMKNIFRGQGVSGTDDDAQAGGAGMVNVHSVNCPHCGRVVFNIS